jgi:hypothetical protein
VVRNRQTAGFAVVVTCLFGIMTSFIGSFEVIVAEVFDQAQLFPVIFGSSPAPRDRRPAERPTRGPGRAAPALARSPRLPRRRRAGARRWWPSRPGAAHRCGPSSSWLALLLPGMSILLPEQQHPPRWRPLPTSPGWPRRARHHLDGGGALLGSRIDAAFDGTVQPFALGVVAFAGVAAVTTFALTRPDRRPA